MRQQTEKIADVVLAIVIGIGMAALLVHELAK